MNENKQNQGEQNIILKIEEDDSNEKISTSTFLDELWNAEESEISEDSNKNPQKLINPEDHNLNQKLIATDIEELADSSSNAEKDVFSNNQFTKNETFEKSLQKKSKTNIEYNTPNVNKK